MAKKHVFQVIVEHDEDGWFVAECPALEACYTQGKTFKEAVDNIRDVIVMCRDDLTKKRRMVPRQSEIIGGNWIEIAV